MSGPVLVFAALAGGYLVSQFFRVAGAVIAPDLMRELALTPATLGAVNGAFFLAFAAAQLPVGLLLDRIGARLTVAGLLVAAAFGAFAFAVAEAAGGLAFGRALSGFGCSAAFMGALVTFARRFPPERFSALTSYVYAIGGSGGLLATWPLARLSDAVGWRGAFAGMGVVTLAIAAAVFVVLSDRSGRAASEGRPETVRQVFAGLAEALRIPDLWRIAALQLVGYGSMFAVLGLWGGPYLSEVHGLEADARGWVLLAANAAGLVGVLAVGELDRRLGATKATVAASAALTVAVLAILALLPHPPLALAAVLLAALGLVSPFFILIYSHAKSLLPPHLAGRGLTFQNASVFLGVFLTQWGGGAIVGRLGAAGVAPDHAYRAVFAACALFLAAGLLVYLRTGAAASGRRRAKA